MNNEHRIGESFIDRLIINTIMIICQNIESSRLYIYHCTVIMIVCFNISYIVYVVKHKLLCLNDHHRYNVVFYVNSISLSDPIA